MLIFQRSIVFSDKIQYCEFMCLARSSDLPLINTYTAASRLERAEKCTRTIISYLHVPSYLIGWTVSAGNSRLSVYGTVNGDRAESGFASARHRPIILHIFTCDGAPAARCTKLMSEEAEGRIEHGSAGRNRNDSWVCVRCSLSYVYLSRILQSLRFARSKFTCTSFMIHRIVIIIVQKIIAE